MDFACAQVTKNKQLLEQIVCAPDLLDEFLSPLLCQGRDVDADDAAVAVRREVQSGS